MKASDQWTATARLPPACTSLLLASIRPNSTQKISAWVEVAGKPVEVYGTTLSAAGDHISAFIESREGESFEVRVHDARSRSEGYDWYLLAYLDGYK